MYPMLHYALTVDSNGNIYKLIRDTCSGGPFHSTGYQVLYKFDSNGNILNEVSSSSLGYDNYESFVCVDDSSNTFVSSGFADSIKFGSLAAYCYHRENTCLVKINR